MSDMSSVGRTWADVRKELLTPEEIAESDLRVALIGELIKARKERGLSQRELEALSGVKQPVIARMENGSTVPNLNTILKVLALLAKLTLLPEDPGLNAKWSVISEIIYTGYMQSF